MSQFQQINTNSQTKPLTGSQIVQQNEVFNFLKDRKNFNFDENDYHGIPRDDCYLQIEQVYDENNEDLNKIDLVNKFFTKFLIKLDQEELSDLLNQNLILFIYHQIKKTTKQINSVNFEKPESNLTNYVNFLELTLDHLITISSSNTLIKYHLFDKFYEVTLKISCVLFEYLKHASLTEISFSQATPSQSMQNLNPSQMELFKKLNSLIIKFSSIIENKTHGLNETQNSHGIARVCYYFTKLASNYLRDAKNLVSLWRVISKLIKNKYFIDFTDLSTVILSVKDTNFDDKKLTAKDIFLKLFEILYESLYSHLKIARVNFGKLGNNDLSNNQQQANTIGSQLRLGNNLAQDTIKIIRFCSFLFKIFKSIFTGNDTLINETFYYITNINAVINCLLLNDYPVTVDNLLEDNVCKNKEFQQIKFEFIKEISINFEQFIQNLTLNLNYLNYLSNLKLENFFSKISIVSSEINIDSFYDKFDYFEEIVLFFSVFLNKIHNFTEIDNMKLIQCIDLILNMVNFCSSAIGLPVYLVLYNQNDFTKFNELNSYEGNFVYLEFYDYLLVNLNNAVRKIAFNCNIEHLIYSLVNNLILTDNENFTIKLKLSNDLLSSYLKSIQTTSKFLKIIQFMFDTYEDLIYNNQSINLKYYEIFLVDIIETLNSRYLQIIEDYLRDKKYFNSYSLGLNTFTKYNDIFIINSFSKLNEFYKEFTQFIDNNKRVLNFEKKLSMFISNKNGFELIDIVLNSIQSSNGLFKTNLQLINSRDQLFKKVNDFFKIDFINNLSTISDSKVDLKTLFKFLSDSIFLWSKISQTIDEINDLMFILNMVNRYCAYNSSIEIDNDFELVLVNFKIQTSYLLKSLSVREVKDSTVLKKIVEVFCVLLEDSNVIVKSFALQCLNTFLESSQTNNKILSEIVRHHTRVKDCVGNYLRQIPISAERSDDQILSSRNEEQIERFKKYFDSKIEANDEKLSEEENDDDNLMDETMNAILCAMDTSASQNPDNSDTLKTRVDTENLLIKIEKDLGKTIEIYCTEHKPNWLRDKLSSIARLINESI